MTKKDMVNGNKETLKKVDENTQVITKKISSERECFSFYN